MLVNILMHVGLELFGDVNRLRQALDVLRPVS